MESSHYFNPYFGLDFFSFFIQFATRLWALLQGNLAFSDLVSDEIQVLTLIGIASSSALVGTFLILRKMTMLANSISHTILIGIVFAFLLTQEVEDPFANRINMHVMLVAALFMGLITAFLTEALTKGARLQEDASTGLVFTTLFAIGIIALTLLTRNAHIGTEVIMGNVDALQLKDNELVYTVLGINIVLFILFFKELKITTFDAGLARSLGISPTFFSYLLMTLVSITAISAFRAVGVLMVLAFFTGPPLIAQLFTHHLKKRLLLSVAIGIFASFVGVAFSRHLLSVYGLVLSTAGIVISTIVGLYAISILSVSLLKKYR